MKRIKLAHYGVPLSGYVARYSGESHVSNIQKPFITNTYTFTVGQSVFSYLLTGTDRVSNFVSSSDPTLTINDTDIIEFDVDADSPSKPFAISTTSAGSIVAPTQHTLVNNSVDSGVVKWYPGAGNTGTFYYRATNDASFKGTINVTANSLISPALSGALVIPSSSNLTGTVNNTFYNALITNTNVNDLVYSWSLSGSTGNCTGTAYGSKYRLETTNNTGLASQTETFHVNVSISSVLASGTIANSGVVLLTHTSG